MPNPEVVLIGGPNGAGKSTAAPVLLNEVLHVGEFVNADVIAQGLSAFNPAEVSFAAGRLMLSRLKSLAAQRRDFAFETTLASRSFAPFLVDLKRNGYHVRLLYLWLAGADLAVSRVAQRVRRGGHAVREDIVRRRYASGLRNLYALYLPLADDWRIYDNSSHDVPRLVAIGHGSVAERIIDSVAWTAIQSSHD